MAEIQIDGKDLHCYIITPAPPKWELQEYIDAYCKESDDKYLAWFLHYYENTLNGNVRKITQQYFMPEAFSNIKQAYVAGLLKALKNYDISVGTPFVVFKKCYAEREVLDCIRNMRTGYTAQSLAEYNKLRRVMAIWDKYERRYTDETIEKIAAETGETDGNIKEILLGGLRNENAAEFYRRYSDDDGDGYDDSGEEYIQDNSSDTEYLYFKAELYSRLMNAYDNLTYEEHTMLAERYGFCTNCYGVFFMDSTDGKAKKKPIPQMMYTDIATNHGYSSANTAKRICDRALEKLRKAIIKWI